MSDLSLKALWITRDGTRDRIASCGSIAIPQGAIVDGEIIQEDIVVERIRELVRISGPKHIGTRGVISSLPETKAFLRIITLPKMSQKEAKEAIKWEIEANIPLSLDQVYYDWQILPETFSTESEKINVLVVAVARSTAEQFCSVLEKAGLEPLGLETESIAQVRSLISERKEDQDKTVLIVDIGDRRTSFVMVINNMPVFTSSTPLSSQMMTDAIAKLTGISLEEAEKRKIQVGLGSLSLPNPQLEAIRPILENLASEIERSLDFYFSTLGYSKKLDAVIFCGGGGNMQGLIPYFSQRLRQNIETGNPWMNIQIGKKNPPVDQSKSLQYSTVIGLALRGLDEYENIA